MEFELSAKYTRVDLENLVRRDLMMRGCTSTSLNWDTESLCLKCTVTKDLPQPQQPQPPAKEQPQASGVKPL